MVIPTGARRNALVLDFGIGAIVDGAAGAPGDRAARLTGSNDTLGTPGYGAPEQWRGIDPTPRADLFSWGLVFLECLTGKPVYAGATTAEILYQELGPDPVPIPAALDHHPFGDILRRATQKDVAARDVTARALLEALDHCDLRALSREAILDGDGFTTGLAGSAAWSTAPSASSARAHDATASHPTAGDRRPLTALCCHLRAHAAPPAAVDAEELDELLRSAVARCADVARHHEGRVAAALGDATFVANDIACELRPARRRPETDLQVAAQAAQPPLWRRRVVVLQLNRWQRPAGHREEREDHDNRRTGRKRRRRDASREVALETKSSW